MIRFATFIILVVLASKADAGCFGKEGCVYNGKRIPEGSIPIREGCYECTCIDDMLDCCSTGEKIVSVGHGCTIIPDGPCSTKAVQLDDPSKPCETGYSGVSGRR